MALCGRGSPQCSLTMRSIMNRIGMIVVDLPNLQTFVSSNGYTLKHVEVVTLESNSTSADFYFLDIPNLKNVKLPCAFYYIRKKSILSIV